MKSIRHHFRRALQHIGIEVHRFVPSSSPAAQIATILHMANIDLVLDVGANEGQFSQEIRAMGYAGHMFLSSPWLRHTPNWNEIVALIPFGIFTHVAHWGQTMEV